MRRLTVRFLLGAMALTTALAVGAQGTADAASSSRHHKTQDGIYLSAEQRELHMRTYQPLDSSMMSRDVYLGGKTRVTIKGPRGTVIEGAIEAGYQVGYPVSFAPNGITIGMQTPSLSISGGLSAGAPLPGIPLPLAGGSITPNVTIIPPTTMTFSVEQGGIETVPLVNRPMNQSIAYGDFSGVQMTVKGAIGPVTIRQYTKLKVRTSAGQSEVVTYGPAWKV